MVVSCFEMQLFSEGTEDLNYQVNAHLITRKRRNYKVDTIVDLMEKEERRKQRAAMEASLARSEEREQQFLNIFEAFTNHVMGK